MIWHHKKSNYLLKCTIFLLILLWCFTDNVSNNKYKKTTGRGNNISFLGDCYKQQSFLEVNVTSFNNEKQKKKPC